MKRKNMISMVTSLALVGVVAVGGTLALLTSQSDKVTNTFTVGDGYETNDFYIDENAVTRDYSATNYGGYKENGASRVEAITYEDVVAGTTLAKDPTLHITSTAPESWVVAKITGLNANAGNLSLEGTISGWYELKDGVWTEVTKAADLKENVLYVYGTKLTTTNLSTSPIFETVRVASTVDEDTTFTQIEVTGVAVEAVADSEWNDETANAVLAAADAVI